MGLAIFLILVEGLAAVALIAVIAFAFNAARKLNKKWPIIVGFLIVGIVIVPSVVAVGMKDYLCDLDSGENIYRTVNASSYYILNEGGNESEGKELIAAVNDVISGRYEYVEVQVLPKARHNQIHHTSLKEMGLRSHLHGKDGGVYRFFKGKRSRSGCVALDGTIGNFASPKIYYGKSAVALAKDKCFGFIYTDESSSEFSIRYFEQEWPAISKLGLTITDNRTGDELAAYNVYEFSPRIFMMLLYGEQVIGSCPRASISEVSDAFTMFHHKVLVPNNKL